MRSGDRLGGRVGAKLPSELRRLPALLALCVCLSCWVGCRPQRAGAPAANAITELEWRALPMLPAEVTRLPPMLKEDGTAIRLRAVGVRTLLVPPLAYTELELEFDSIPAQKSGATLSLDLPPGAAVSRFAVQDQGSFHDAEIVDSRQARTALSSSTQTQRVSDPDEPRHFSVRVLKQAQQAPRLLVAYAETLPTARTPYRIPLMGLTHLDSLHVTVDTGEPQFRRYRLARTSFTPDRDFVLGAERLGAAGGSGTLAWRAGKYLVARITPDTIPNPELTFLVDTSLSEPIPLERVSERLVSISQALAKQQPDLLISVVGFDQDIYPILLRSRAPLTTLQLAPLRELGRLGGTDLVYADSALRARQLPHGHVVLLSDLQNSLTRASDIARPGNLEPLRGDFLAVNDAAETKLRQEIRDTRDFTSFPGVIARLAGDATQIARRLLEPTPKKVRSFISGASWATPANAPGFERLTPASELELEPEPGEHAEETESEVTPRIGDAAWVFAELANQKSFELTVQGKAVSNVKTSSDPALSALLAQLVGQARLNQIFAGDSSQVTRVSKAYGLLSEQSSFLVRAGAGSSPALAGRAVEPMTLPAYIDPPRKSHDQATSVANESCPDMIGLANQRASDKRCPPLYVSFSEPEERIIADVQFAAGSTQPNLAASPHLRQLADLLALRPELVTLAVKASSKARAEGIIRYLVSRGISAGRLQPERLIEGSLPARHPTPNCKSSGEPVLFEVRSMSAAPLSPPISKKPAPTAAVSPSRLVKIDQLLREAALTVDKSALARAQQLSERWVAEAPASPLPYIALGNSLSASGDSQGAARAYGSLFELDVPGAGLTLAAAVRIQQLATGSDGDIAAGARRQQSQDPHARLEASRANAYFSLAAERRQDAFYAMFEAAGHSAISARIELPAMAQLYATQTRDAAAVLESSLPRDCTFPLQASVLGALLSWQDTSSELEVSVTSVAGKYSYDSVLAEHGEGGGLKWVPLPEDDDSYPITVTVRAEHLGKNGYAFGTLRTLNSLGKKRVRVAEKPFVATQVDEPLTLIEEEILQRPQ